MRFTTFDLLVVVVYLVGIGGLGIYQARKIKGSGDFFAGGRKFNKYLMMMHALGTGTHADDPVGVVGASYQRGLSGIWYTFVYLFITPFYWIIAPLFRRSRYLTTADFFEARFGGSLGLLYAIMGILTFTVNMGTMLKGTGAIANAVTQGLIPEMWAIAVMAVIFVAYGTAGGLVATVITESVQGFLIVVMSILLVPFGLMLVGGFSGLHNTLDASMFNLSTPLEMSIPWIVAAAAANLIGIVSQPHTMEVCSTGKTEWEGRVGFTFGNFVKRFCALGWALSGIIMAALVVSGSVEGLAHREEAFGTAIRVILPVGFTGLMVASILAAQMSTLSAFMVAGSALLSRNVYKKWLRPGATDHDVVTVARVAGIVIVMLGVCFAFIVPGVAEALTIFWAVTTFTGLFMWFGVLWRRTNATGAWASFLIMVPIWILLGPIGIKLNAMFPAFEWLGMYGDKSQLHYLLASYLPAGIIALVVGSFLGKQMDKKKLDQFYMLLNTPVGQEAKLAEAGVNVVYAGESKGHPWEIKHGRKVNVIGFVVAMMISSLFLVLLYLISKIGM